MPSCSQCGLPLDTASQFCSRCGALPQKSKPFLYSGSVVLGIALLALAGIWELVSVESPPASHQQVVVSAPPDDATVFITNCGLPDKDTPETTNGLESRSLLYRKARVTAIFVRSESSRWKTQAMVDPKSLKAITPDRLAKRLPCASGITKEK
jgi:hypothetical protein